MEYMALVLLLSGKLLALGPFDDVASCKANEDVVVETVMETFPDETIIVVSCGEAPNV